MMFNFRLRYPILLMGGMFLQLHQQCIYYVSGQDFGAENQFNYEVGLRVHERVSEFISIPKYALDLISNYRANGYSFPHDLDAADRDEFLLTADALLETFPIDMVFYGLEDGLFVGKKSNVAGGTTYREPGEGGYLVGSTEESDAGRMQKHYIGCVDEEGSVSCDLDTGDKYIQVVGDLEKCPDDDSQNNDEDVKWCKSYELKQVQEGESLGYIPRLDYCVDRGGLPTQQPGTVFKGKGEELGNCYLGDEKTPVVWDVTGDYAYCGDANATCNPFLGAYRSRNYDPRWRDWYTTSKELQKPNWSPPYADFSSKKTVVSFCKPIYRIENGKNVFTGVLGIDYTLSSIGDFLVESYKDSNYIVAIVEEDEPNYIVALSSGTSSTKEVLKSNTSIPCPLETNEECVSTRVTVGELATHDNHIDRAVAKAFEAQQGLLQLELVAVQVDTDNIYASQTISLTGDDGLKWLIIIMEQLEESSKDTIKQTDSVIILCATVLGSFSSVVLLALYLQHRNKRDIAFSDWRFTSLFIFGCILLNLSCISFIGENSNELCLLRMWLLHMCFVLTLAPLFVKTYRMYLLVGGNLGVKKQISHLKTALMMLPFIGAEVAILLIFTFIDPSKNEVNIVVGGSDVGYSNICSHDTKAFFIVQLVYEGGLIVVGSLLAFKTRHMKKDFGESKQLIFVMYQIALVGIVIIVVGSLAEVTYELLRIIVTCMVCWCTSISSAVFVLPRLLRMRAREGAVSVKVSGLVEEGASVKVSESVEEGT